MARWIEWCHWSVLEESERATDRERKRGRKREGARERMNT